MNLHLVRLKLAKAIKDADPKWSPTTATVPDLNATLTAQVGHVVPTQATFRSKRLELPLTLWANEGNARGSVEDLYGAIMWGREAPDALVERLLKLDWITNITVDAVGEQREGLTGFLAADLTVSIDLSKV